VVAYELLTGSRPFVAEHAAAQARLHVEQPPPRATAAAPDLPPAVDDVLEKGLAKDPAQRWPTAVAFVEALERAVGDAATTPVTMGTTELTERLPPVPVPVAVPAPAAGAARRASPPPAPRAPRPPAGPSGPPPARRDGRGWRPLAVLGIFALALVGLAIALAGGGDDDPERASTTRASDPTTPRARTQPANTTPTSSTPARSPATGSPAQLNDRGYDLMRAGRYAEAIPLLEQAVAAYPEDSNDLTYAYALYNLGRSLRLAGRPADAIPYLERRLRFDNQRDVVQAELDAARREAGVAPGNGKVKKNKEKAGDD
jgi:serine/threonine-protein kinase